MSYGRILKPRIYADQLAHFALRGYAPSSLMNVALNGVQTGSNLYDLIAMRPQVRTVFDTSGETADVLVAFDFPQAIDATFLAILNHNMKTADAGVRLYHYTSAITSINYGSATEVTLTDVVGDLSSGTAVNNDSYIGTFASTYKQYWAVKFHDVSTFDADLQVGSIMLGLYWDAPFAPDLQVKRTVSHEGIQINETRGGKRYANAGWITGSEGSALPYGAPFRPDGVGTIYEHHAGRREYDMTFSRLADTLVTEEDFATGVVGDATATLKWRDLMSLCDGGALPVIFTPDGTSTTSGDYLFARITEGTETQVAPLVWTVSAKVSEEF